MFGMSRLFYKYLTPLLVLSVIPILASGVLMFVLTMANFDNLQKRLVEEISGDLRSEILAKNLSLATSEGKNIEQVVDQIGSLLSVLSVSPDFLKKDIFGMNNYAENIMSDKVPILEFTVINEWGELVYKKENSFSLSGVDSKGLIDTVYKQVKEEKKSELSDVLIAENSQQPYVVLAQPILDYGGNLKGCIAATVSLGFISEALKNTSESKGVTYIISSNGTLISHPNMFELNQNLDYSKYDYIQTILKRKEGSFENEGKLFSYYTTRYGWKIIVEIPTEIALASLERNKSTINAFIRITLNSISYAIAIVIILSIAVCIIVAILITNRTIKPIIELTNATKKIYKGNFNLRVEKTSKDEIGQLTESFNLMAQEISRKQEELINKNEYIKQQADELLARYNSDLEQFAYVTTHDLIEPLRMITSYTQLLQRRHSDNFNNDAKEYMNYVIEGVHRMHKIINDLFEYSHIRTNESDFEVTDFNEVIDAVLKKIEPEVTEGKAMIVTDKMPTVKAVKSNMVQVFQNLISNAIKFKSPARKCEIRVGFEEKPKEWLFYVKDNGIGFEPKYAEKVFEIFKRLNKRDQYAGSGMGLAICKNIVERHGGKIWVEPVVDEGTTFFFTIKKI
jgi:signal transduction histidine kinase